MITLLGQNVNSYGKDKKDHEISFAKLLGKIGEMALSTKKKFWLYYTSPHPQDMEIEVIETMAKYPAIAKQIHLPLQSGDDRVLIRMNRNHNMDRYRTIVENIKRLIPEATLFTDIIVGFSGENEEQFENSRLAMKEFQYNMAYIAQYSPRPGARASRWIDDVETKEKKRRLHVLTDILKESSLKYNQKLINRELPVIVEKFEEKTEYYSGRTEGKILIRFKSSKECTVGDFSLVKITSVRALSIEGVAV